ncbi:hypothetical protein TRIUR3_05604 [Triticum urartu]|uniref:Uncharacterized protein n=1 Tax=Triticum urartu TaxID=4572 RepID=M7YTN7_TRIUA|nr:hypothetical protein TRIUR3_05604 [Triticum urartu]
MLPALRPRLRLPLAHLCRLLSSSSSASGEGAPPVAPTDAAAKAREAHAARMEAYKKVQEFDWSSGADWKTAANILFTVPPKRKEFGLDFHLVQLFFVCMPSLAVYLVAQYARSEIKRMEAEAEVKRKKIEEVEKQKQLEADSVKEDADSKLATVLVRLDTLEGVVKEIAEDKMRSPAHTKEESLKKGETSSPDKASASKSDGSDSQLASVKIKDIKDATNAPPDATQQDTKPDRGKTNVCGAGKGLDPVAPFLFEGEQLAPFLFEGDQLALRSHGYVDPFAENCGSFAPGGQRV